MNLTQEFPRSPKEQMAGLVHIPRMKDKARAARDNTLGEYIYPCPLDEIMLEFLDVDSETFQHRACDDTEETLAAWVAEDYGERDPSKPPAGQSEKVGILLRNPGQVEPFTERHHHLGGFDRLGGRTHLNTADTRLPLDAFLNDL